MEIMSASRAPLRGRKPKTKQEGRVCKHEGCTTRLSRYNRKDLCYAHAPARFPRVRGQESRSS